MEKIKIILSGCSGKLGSAIAKQAKESEKFAVVCGVDVNATDAPFPVLGSFGAVTEDADVLIDASHHSTTPELLEYRSARRPRRDLHDGSHRGGSRADKARVGEDPDPQIAQYVRRY